MRRLSSRDGSPTAAPSRRGAAPSLGHAEHRVASPATAGMPSALATMPGLRGWVRRWRRHRRPATDRGTPLLRTRGRSDEMPGAETRTAGEGRRRLPCAPGPAGPARQIVGASPQVPVGDAPQPGGGLLDRLAPRAAPSLPPAITRRRAGSRSAGSSSSRIWASRIPASSPPPARRGIPAHSRARRGHPPARRPHAAIPSRGRRERPGATPPARSAGAGPARGDPGRGGKAVQAERSGHLRGRVTSRGFRHGERSGRSGSPKPSAARCCNASRPPTLGTPGRDQDLVATRNPQRRQGAQAACGRRPTAEREVRDLHLAPKRGSGPPVRGNSSSRVCTRKRLRRPRQRPGPPMAGAARRASPRRSPS